MFAQFRAGNDWICKPTSGNVGAIGRSPWFHSRMIGFNRKPFRIDPMPCLREPGRPPVAPTGVGLIQSGSVGNRAHTWVRPYKYNHTTHYQ
ncbi:hypothetical protein [Xanthocytophaga flava]|uniref:hypothetical protein n=1 Tax=Xanthocytophaga flava TaxID=3048013 RepID=UPI0028D7B45A|nr:hypothetical protein [Xanthocytophaga flavus]MDJ1470835.1 hypothetical protein [Xanthocytophaga flavus]